MEYKSKLADYKVSIRRQQISQKIANLRAKNQPQQPELENVQEVIKLIREIFSNESALVIYGRVGEMMKYSQNLQILGTLKDYFQGFYRLLVEVDTHNTDKNQASQLYNTICTILINIVSQEDIDFTQQIKDDIASPVLKNMGVRDREIDTIWFVANILYRKNSFSRHFMLMLVKNQVSLYIKKRLTFSFESESQNTIFYYFVGAVTANLDAVSVYSDFKALLEPIQYLSQLQIEECYLFILDGLVCYADSFRKHQYQIFVTNILKKCEGYCLNKKSRFVGKYLDIVSNFIRSEVSYLSQVQEGKRKKELNEQYERVNKYKFIKNMVYCLENRMPDIKRRLFEISWMLITFYFEEIDLEMQDFYINLAQEITNVEKYNEVIVFPMLKYIQSLIISLLKLGTVKKNSQYADTLVKFLESILFFDKVEFLLRQYGNSIQIINLCFNILAYLRDYDIQYLQQALQKANLIPVLQSLQIHEPKTAEKRDILMNYIQSQQEGMMEL